MRPHFARTGWRYSKAKLSRNKRRSDLPVFNMKQNLAKKLEPTLKQSNLKEMAYLSTTFLRGIMIDPEFLTRVLHAHPEA